MVVLTLILWAGAAFSVDAIDSAKLLQEGNDLYAKALEGGKDLVASSERTIEILEGQIKGLMEPEVTDIRELTVMLHPVYDRNIRINAFLVATFTSIKNIGQHMVDFAQGHPLSGTTPELIRDLDKASEMLTSMKLCNSKGAAPRDPLSQLKNLKEGREAGEILTRNIEKEIEDFKPVEEAIEATEKMCKQGTKRLDEGNFKKFYEKAVLYKETLAFRKKVLLSTKEVYDAIKIESQGMEGAAKAAAFVNDLFGFGKG